MTPRNTIPAALVAATVLATPAMACNDGDRLVKIAAPFDLYENYETVKARGYGHGGGEPLGHFTSSGVVCIDNGLNKAVPPAQDWTWVYFSYGLRDFKGVAPLSAFRQD